MIGKTISHYKITRELGSGGMGVVYEAVDTKLDRTVALKFLPPESTRDPDAKARFIHEAKAASALDHPNVCTIYEVDETDDGQLFLAMARYEGGTLKERIDRGPMPLDDAMDITRQVAKGLTEAHARKIVHRDIKPANIFITDGGLAKILDFGLAKLAGLTQLTQEGSTLGTAHYMSPEQAGGQEVDHRSDLWCLGVVLYEMITGRVPFQGDHAQAVAYAILNTDPEPVTGLRTGVPMELERVIRKCLAKDPRERYQHAGDLLADLRHLRRETAQGLTKPLAIGESRSNRSRLWPRVLGIIAAAVVVAGGFAGYHRFKDSPESYETLGDNQPLVIAIAPFWGQNADAIEEGKVMQALVERQVAEQFADDKNVKIRGKNEIKEMPRSKEEAKALGEALDVHIVLWGEVLVLRGEVEIQPYATVTGDLRTEENRKTGAMRSDLAQGDQLSMRKAKAEDIGDLVLLLAGAYYRIRDPAKSLALLQEIASPTSESVRRQGYIFSDRGDLAKAEALYQKAIEIDFCDAYPYFSLGNLYRRQARYEEALTWYKKSIEIDPDFRFTYNAIGYLYQTRNDFEEATTWLEEAIRRFPDYASAYVSRGLVESNQGRFKEAIEWYKKAIAVDPTIPNAYTGIGASYRFMGNSDEGLKWYKKSIEVDPVFAMPYSNIGNIYAEKKQFGEADKWYRKAIEAFPGWYGSHKNLGNLYMALGKIEEASRSFEKAYQLSPRIIVNGLNHFLCLRMMGAESEAAASLAALAHADGDSSMTTTIIQFYAGNLTEDNILAVVERMRSVELDMWENLYLQDAYYYLAMASLQGIPDGTPPDTSKAIAYLEESIAVNTTAFPNWGCEALLERLRTR